MKFAKLFERGNEQVLVMTEYEEDTDTTIVRCVSELDGGRVEEKFLFDGENQTEAAANLLDSFSEENAFSFLDKYSALLGS